MNQHKVIGILAASAILAAGLLSAVKPAAASGLMHPLQISQQTTIAQHDGDRNYDGNRNYNGDRNYNDDHQREERRREEFRQEQFRQAEFRRQQEIRRIEERRREERLHNHRRDFRDGGRYDNQDRHQDNRGFDQHNDNR